VTGHADPPVGAGCPADPGSTPRSAHASWLLVRHRFHPACSGFAALTSNASAGLLEARGRTLAVGQGRPKPAMAGRIERSRRAHRHLPGKRKQQRPKAAANPDNQRRVIELAQALVSQAGRGGGQRYCWPVPRS
jgi:hypothetical protein